MSYVPGIAKWEGNIGTPADQPVTWSTNYFDGLDTRPGTTEAQFDNALQMVFDAWESVAAITFEFVTTGAAADIAIFSESLDDRSDDPNSQVAGVASISRDGSEIINVDVSFTTDLAWAPFGGPGYGDFFAVALHEIGHAIGLEHVLDEDEIMNPIISTSELGNGDIAAAQYLYGPADGAEVADAEQVAPPTNDGISISSGGGGGGGGGAIAALLGILAAIFGFLPLGAVAVAAGALPSRDDDNADSIDDSPAPDLSELLPTVTSEHYIYLAGFGDHTGMPGCPCQACHEQQMEDEEAENNFFF